MDFNEQIKRLRKENNLTQEEMAKKLNVTRQAISNWENNRNLPDFEMIIFTQDHNLYYTEGLVKTITVLGDFNSVNIIH